jgi:hypothetical protein
LLETEVFDEEGVCSKTVGTIDVIHVTRSGKDDDGQGSESVLLANPGEDLEAVNAPEFQVQKDEDREGILRAIGELAFTAEVGDGVFARATELNGVFEGSLFKGGLHQEDIRLAVFNDKNYVVIWHSGLSPRAMQC